jgi:pyrroloquinoline quinone (PQQ) biosynthesis protein C
MDANIYEGWSKTEKVKEDRINKQKTFNEFIRSKKLTHLKSLRDQDEKDFKEGLEMF